MIYLDVQIPKPEEETVKETVQVSGKKPAGKTYCPYCNRETVLIWVHGHYQCSRCKYVVNSCCESN